MWQWRAAIRFLCGLTMCVQTTYAHPVSPNAHVIEADIHSVLYSDLLLTTLARALPIREHCLPN
ncbi:hypothetical protein [Alicyclobacillus fodiniaquatilis]|uniref:Secreted protein n=1 Tax=Alicyclobacillus fodiniaquatilis TaxID=1661150 RepID=A0ABW4JBR6_9BACL